jgi:hypothetical protein
MTKFKPLLIAVVATLMLGLACKKEENGNKITLTTKKHRITERWTMTRGRVGLTQFVNGTGYNSSFEFTQGQGILTQTGNNTAYTLPYNLYIEFQKDGKFNLTEDFNSVTRIADGEWDFNEKDKDNEQKAKTAALLSLKNAKSGKIEDILFNHFVTEIKYTLKVLSKDELKISASTIYYYQGTDKWTIQSEYTFKKQ